MTRLYEYESELIKQGYKKIAGLDEAGRGPLAGPLVVAIVVLPINYELPGLNDSKKLTAKKRDELYDIIIHDALVHEVKVVSEQVIDDVNIYQATKQAMIELVSIVKPDYVLTDAMPLTEDIKHQSIIKGDSKSLTIAAASVIAKVTRDRIMHQLDKTYPQYGLKKHKGYGTKEHIKAIFDFGPTNIHRKTYKPVSDLIKGNK